MEIKIPKMKMTKATIREYYVDENGHMQDREKEIEIPTGDFEEPEENKKGIKE